ncbi:MAG: biotin/lipoyl-containing protein [Omnitrophica WOR_2 bacterium]
MRYRFQSNDQVYEISLEKQGVHYQANVYGESYEFDILDIHPGEISMNLQGRPAILYWAADGDQQWISMDGCTYLLEKPTTRPKLRPGERSAEDVLRSPMPAQVRSVLVSEGENVQKGQAVLLLEAMKMEIRVQSPRSGQILRLLVKEGQPVERNQILIEIGDQK